MEPTEKNNQELNTQNAPMEDAAPTIQRGIHKHGIAVRIALFVGTIVIGLILAVLISQYVFTPAKPPVVDTSNEPQDTQYEQPTNDEWLSRMEDLRLDETTVATPEEERDSRLETLRATE